MSQRGNSTFGLIPGAAILFLACSATPSGAQSVWYEIVRKVAAKTAMKGATRAGVSAAPVIEVEFAPDHVTVADAVGRTTHDFAGKRLTTVKKGAKSASEPVPVHGLVHFLDLELAARRSGS